MRVELISAPCRMADEMYKPILESKRSSM